MKHKGMRIKKGMRNEIVESIFKTKQTKYENLASETFPVLNKIVHCINVKCQGHLTVKVILIYVCGKVLT